MSRWQSANVLQITPGLSQLWRFTASGESFAFTQGQTFLPSESIPSSHVAKDWSSLFRQKLNLAWMPASNVFMRVIQLPTSDLSEVVSMVELQLEKLSPLPVAQIVWGLELLPRPADKPEALQTVIVAIVSRAHVDEHLAGLEAKGYLADSLEVPCVDQLVKTKVEEDGVWIYIGAEGEPALVAWWYGGALQNLALVTLAKGSEKEALLKSQLEQMAWSAELDGWLTGPLAIHLVAEPAEVAIWEPVMRTWADQAFSIVQPTPPNELAASSARRAARPDCKSNLLPPDYSTRYRQRFIDGLWMRGLLAVLGIYALGVVIYLTALFVVNSQSKQLIQEAASLSGSYTNALRDKARIQIIKDRQELKYAGLDCWKAVAQTLPENLTLDQIYFQRGKLALRGTVPEDQKIDVTTFHESVRQSTANGEPLFIEVGMPSFTSRGQVTEWKFSCTLKGDVSK